MGRSRAEYSLPKKTRGILSEAGGSAGSTRVANLLQTEFFFPTESVFSSRNFLNLGTVALSLLFDN